MNKNDIFRTAITDRSYLLAIIATAVMLIAIIILGIVEVRPSELQVPIRNTVFGITFTYREQWYNELGLIGIGVMVAVLHTLISLKLFTIKDRRYAIAFQWLTVVVLAIMFVVLMAIFKLISIVE